MGPKDDVGLIAFVASTLRGFRRLFPKVGPNGYVVLIAFVARTLRGFRRLSSNDDSLVYVGLIAFAASILRGSFLRIDHMRFTVLQRQLRLPLAMITFTSET